MITKESGEIGGVIDKIDAANKKDIVSNLDELDYKLKSYF